MFRRYLYVSLFLSFLASATLIAWNLVPSVETAGQRKERKIKARLWRNEPIKVTSIQGNQGSIVLGEAKLAEDNWLQNLEITIQNTSKKDIVFVEVELHFLRPEGSTEPATAFPMIFGTPPPKVDEKTQVLRPGETWHSSLSESDYNVLQDLLNKTGFSTGVIEVELVTREVLFRDKKRWFAGEERDPDQPVAKLKKNS